MPSLQLAHTGQLAPEVLAGARALLVDVFAGELSPTDWEHCLGGLHALVWDGSELVGHGALVTRRVLHRGRTWRAGYVEGVGIRADLRRRGHGGALMTALEDVARRAHDLAALSATDDGAPFYASRGWQRWQGTTSALTPDGRRRTPEDDDAVFVLPLAVELDVRGELVCDWREGDLW